jgi:hypothetical protein
MGGGAPDTSGQNEAARMNAEIAKEIWEQYKTTYLPMENQYVQDAQQYDTPEHREQAARAASADTEQAFANQKGANERSMTGMGIRPDDAKFAAVNARLQRDQAAQSAGAQNSARLGVEQEGWARRTNALSLGKGLPTQASGAASAAGNLYGQANNQRMQYDNQQSSDIAGGIGGGLAAGHGLGWWADGGYVGIKRPVHLAMGGPAGLQQILQNQQQMYSPPPPGRSPVNSFVQGAQMGKNAAQAAKGIYGAMKPAGVEAMKDGSTVDVGMDALAGGEAVAPEAAGVAAEGIGGGAAGAAAADAAATAAAETAATTAATAAAGSGAAATAAEMAPLLIALLADGGTVDGTAGGKIAGPGTETSDSIPARLSDGEYVLNADAVRHFGIARLDKMNEVGLRMRQSRAGGIRR